MSGGQMPGPRCPAPDGRSGRGIVQRVSALLDNFAADVRSCLTDFVYHQHAELAPIGSQIAPLLDATAEFVSGGKLLRPAFCFAGWVTAGGDPHDHRIVWASSAFEWLQASALAHDDLMDDSDTRRGKPSLHRRFAADHGGADADADAYGRSVAILIGDLMLSWSDSVLRRAFTDPADAARLHSALDYFDRARSEVVAGQYLDITAHSNSEKTRRPVTRQQAAQIMSYKSAKYTVERPLHVGAALAGADDDLIGQLSEYALPLGEAFQLRDDLLGVFGDPRVTGKPAGDDLREGKRTVLIARARELAGATERQFIDDHLGEAGHIDAVREAIENSGARMAVESDIDARIESARDALDRLPADGHALLAELLVRVSHREH